MLQAWLRNGVGRVYRRSLIGAVLMVMTMSNVVQAQKAARVDDTERWVDNTSGPTYTGTADVMPGGSFYIEPYYFNYRTAGGSSTALPLKLAYGIGHRMEADLFLPVDYSGATADHGGAYAFGDTVAQVKYGLRKERDRYHLWRAPSLGVSFDLNIPTGQLKNSKPNVYGGSQTTNGTWNEQVNLLVRKQFKPFELYLEGTEIVQNPVDISGPYDFNNGIDSVAPGTPFHVVDGNVLAADAALEHVVVPRWGLGYLIEMNAQRQSGRSLLFGLATAPAFSYLDLSPELEVTWPGKGRFPITWGGGVTFTALRSDYPKQLTPVFTVTFNGDLHGGRSIAAAGWVRQAERIRIRLEILNPFRETKRISVYIV